MIFFKIFHDFSPQATSPFAAGEKNSPQAKRTRRRRRELAAGEENSPQAKHTHSPQAKKTRRQAKPSTDFRGTSRWFRRCRGRSRTAGRSRGGGAPC